MKTKKNELVKSIKEKLDNNEALTEEETNDLASKWMEIADFDQSGTIDVGELSELIKKLDEKFDESKITDIFSAQDDD